MREVSKEVVREIKVFPPTLQTGACGASLMRAKWRRWHKTLLTNLAGHAGQWSVSVCNAYSSALSHRSLPEQPRRVIPPHSSSLPNGDWHWLCKSPSRAPPPPTSNQYLLSKSSYFIQLLIRGASTGVECIYIGRLSECSGIAFWKRLQNSCQWAKDQMGNALWCANSLRHGKMD